MSEALAFVAACGSAEVQMSNPNATALTDLLVGFCSLVVVLLLARQSVKHPRRITRFVHDAPVWITYALGTWLLAAFGWAWAVGYVLCVVLCSVWFMLTVCPHCHCHGHAGGPSVYCVWARRLHEKSDEPRFAERFRRHTKIMAIPWLLPPVAGIVRAVQSYDTGWEFAGEVVLLIAFVLIGFWLVPLSAKPRCAWCANREACPHGEKSGGDPLGSGGVG